MPDLPHYTGYASQTQVHPSSYGLHGPSREMSNLYRWYVTLYITVVTFTEEALVSRPGLLSKITNLHALAEFCMSCLHSLV